MDTSRRGFLRMLGAATAAGAAAPVIDKLDYLVRQPSSIITPDFDKYFVQVDANGQSLEELYNTVRFTVTGLEKDDRVSVIRTDTGEVIYNGVPNKPYLDTDIRLHDDMADAASYAESMSGITPEMRGYAANGGVGIGLAPVKQEGATIDYDPPVPSVPLMVRVRNAGAKIMPFEGHALAAAGGANVLTALRVEDRVAMLDNDPYKAEGLGVKRKRNGDTVLVPRRFTEPRWNVRKT